MDILITLSLVFGPVILFILTFFIVIWILNLLKNNYKLWVIEYSPHKDKYFLISKFFPFKIKVSEYYGFDSEEDAARSAKYRITEIVNRKIKLQKNKLKLQSGTKTIDYSSLEKEAKIQADKEHLEELLKQYR